MKVKSLMNYLEDFGEDREVVVKVKTTDAFQLGEDTLFEVQSVALQVGPDFDELLVVIEIGDHIQ